MSDTIAAAASYTAAGICTIPVRADGSKKADLAAWKPFQARMPTSEEMSDWWGNGTVRGIATVCGTVSQNLLKFDFDALGWFERFAALCTEHGYGALIDSMPLIGTPTEGRHLEVRCSGPVPGNLKLAWQLLEIGERTVFTRGKGEHARWGDDEYPVVVKDGRKYGKAIGIETRGEGGYCLAPGSPAACHLTGKTYRYLRLRPKDIPIITPEELSVLLALASTLNEYAEPEQIIDAPRLKRPATSDGLRPGDDYNSRGDYESLLAEDGWRQKGSAGDKRLWQRPGKQGRGISATSNYAGSGLFYVFSSNAAPFASEKAYSPFAVYALLKHGGDFTEAARDLGKRGFGNQTSPAARREMSAAKAPSPPPPATTPPAANKAGGDERLPLTEIGLGQRLARRHGQDLRYSFEMGRWFIWDGARFCLDITGEIERRAKDTARRIFEEAAACHDAAEQGEIAKFALQAQRLAKRQGMITDARSEPNIPVAVSDWDRNAWLLTCRNGTLDLKTGHLRPPRREDLITKLAPVAYDPGAACPLWENFLARVLPHPEVRAYVQRAAGYSLTGDIGEQILFFLHGGGQNGKSTLLGTLLAVLGDYSLQAAPDLLIAKDSTGGPNNEIAELRGARLVATIEVEDGKRMAEGLVKQITGGDRIKARFMRQDFFEFEPTHKIWLAANHKPSIKGQDRAIWRRIKMIPFDVEIPDAEKDPQLADKLRAELPGILAWAVCGCQEWQQIGMAEPEAVKAATDEYKQEQDVLGDFLAECCVLRPALQVSSSGVYTAYTKWCEENGERAMGKKTFSQRLREQKGVFQAVGIGAKAARGWQGVGLRDKGGYEFPDTSDTSDKNLPISTKKNDSYSVIGKKLSEVSEVSEADDSDIDPFAADAPPG